MFETLSFGTATMLALFGVIPTIRLVIKESKKSATIKDTLIAGAGLLVGAYGFINAMVIVVKA